MKRITFKILIYIILIPIASIIGASYGAIHDQISYTVSSDYFIYGYELWIDNTIKSLVEFVRVVIMHNASCYGGRIGLFIAAGWLIYRGLTFRKDNVIHPPAKALA